MSYEYDDDYEEPTEEEMEERDGMESTNSEFKGENLEISFNTVNFANGIIAEVAATVKKNLETSIIESIKKEILDDIKEKIQTTTGEIIREILNDYMENEKITIGGKSFWDDEPLQVFTLKEYAKKCIGDSIKNEKFKFVTGYEKDRYDDRHRAKTSESTFSDYIRSELAIGNDIKEYIDKQILEIKNNVNHDVKKVFDESTKKMLSESVLNVLMANDTYKKIESNLASIADRTVEYNNEW